MPSREQVKRWAESERAKDEAIAKASSFAIQYENMRDGDGRVIEMADMLERAAEVARLAVWGDGRATSAAEMWLAEWNGDNGDGAE